MNFDMTDERRMLAESLARFLEERCPIEKRADVAYAAPFHAPETWEALVELGVFYALVPEAEGGMGGAGFDIATVFEELGRALCPEPVLPALLASQLLRAARQDQSALLDGNRYAVAIGELDAPYDLEGTSTTAVEQDGHWELSGRKSVVYGGGCAEHLLVAAKTDGKIGLFHCAAADAEHTAYAMVDGGPAAEVFLDATPAECLLLDARSAFETALDAGALALAAEALGAMQSANDLLSDYLRTRRQFGQPLGSFQALAHRAIDLAIDIEQARSSVILAADAWDTSEQTYRISQAKHLVGDIARRIAEETIQMHGGIGLTWEYPLSHIAKRLVMIDHQLGDSDHHLEKLMNNVMYG